MLEEVEEIEAKRPPKVLKNHTLAKAFPLTRLEYPHILEFGVFEGRSLMLIKRLHQNSKETRGEVDQRKIYGFDSFEGLPELWQGTKNRKDIKKFSTGGELPAIDDVKFFKGWFSETLPIYLQEAAPISLLHIDCDLYSSAREVLFSLNSFIKSGTIIVFDEWYYNHRDLPKNREHEQKAYYEWVEQHNRSCDILEEVESERRIVRVIK